MNSLKATIALIFSLVACNGFAERTVFVIQPTIKGPDTILPGSTFFTEYSITNNTPLTLNNNYIHNLPAGMTIARAATNPCTLPYFNLSPGASCRILIQVDSSKFAATATLQAPEVCHNGRPIRCSIPSAANRISFVQSKNPANIVPLSVFTNSIWQIGQTNRIIVKNNSSSSYANGITLRMPADFHGSIVSNNCQLLAPGAQCEIIARIATSALAGTAGTISIQASNAYPVYNSIRLLLPSVSVLGNNVTSPPVFYFNGPLARQNITFISTYDEEIPVEEILPANYNNLTIADSSCLFDLIRMKYIVPIRGSCAITFEATFSAAEIGTISPPPVYIQNELAVVLNVKGSLQTTNVSNHLLIPSITASPDPFIIVQPTPTVNTLTITNSSSSFNAYTLIFPDLTEADITVQPTSTCTLNSYFILNSGDSCTIDLVAETIDAQHEGVIKVYLNHYPDPIYNFIIYNNANPFKPISTSATTLSYTTVGQSEVLTITNTNLYEVNITSIVSAAVSGIPGINNPASPNAASATSSTCAMPGTGQYTVPANGSCTITFQSTALTSAPSTPNTTHATTSTGSVQINYTANGSPYIATFNVDVLTPKITFAVVVAPVQTNKLVWFGALNGDDIPVDVLNLNTSIFTIGPITVNTTQSGVNANVRQNGCSGTLAPGQSCRIIINRTNLGSGVTSAGEVIFNGRFYVENYTDTNTGKNYPLTIASVALPEP